MLTKLKHRLKRQGKVLIPIPNFQEVHIVLDNIRNDMYPEFGVYFKKESIIVYGLPKEDLNIIRLILESQFSTVKLATNNVITYGTDDIGFFYVRG